MRSRSVMLVVPVTSCPFHSLKPSWQNHLAVTTLLLLLIIIIIIIDHHHYHYGPHYMAVIIMVILFITPPLSSFVIVVVIIIITLLVSRRLCATSIHFILLLTFYTVFQFFLQRKLWKSSFILQTQACPKVPWSNVTILNTMYKHLSKFVFLLRQLVKCKL